MQVLPHVEVTSDKDFMKYKGSLIFGSAYMISVGCKAFPCNVMQTNLTELIFSAGIVKLKPMFEQHGFKQLCA